MDTRTGSRGCRAGRAAVEVRRYDPAGIPPRLFGRRASGVVRGGDQGARVWFFGQDSGRVELTIPPREYAGLSRKDKQVWLESIKAQSGVDLMEIGPAIMQPELFESVLYPHPTLANTYQPGSTEPWIVELLAALLKASGQKTVLELGGYIGITSAWLALTLAQMGGGDLTIAEYDPEAPERADAVQTRLEALNLTNVTWRVMRDDAVRVIRSLPDESLGLVYVDDNHEKAHVHEELDALIPKMVPGGLITGHDVWGTCELREVFERFGGYAIDLPRLGPAGGLGILQVR